MEKLWIRVIYIKMQYFSNFAVSRDRMLRCESCDGYSFARLENSVSPILSLKNTLCRTGGKNNRHPVFAQESVAVFRIFHSYIKIVGAPAFNLNALLLADY